MCAVTNTMVATRTSEPCNFGSLSRNGTPIVLLSYCPIVLFSYSSIVLIAYSPSGWSAHCPVRLLVVLPYCSIGLLPYCPIDPLRICGSGSLVASLNATGSLFPDLENLIPVVAFFSIHAIVCMAILKASIVGFPINLLS